MSAGSNAPRRLTVGLGDRSYEILVGGGLLADAGSHIGPLLARPNTVVVTDTEVAARHLATLQAGLARSGIASEAIVLPAGEKTKSMEQLGALLDRLLELKVERRDMVIALGGGVIGDLTGFAAAILRRGMDFIQIPTTLLAQVDSSVGGKTGINTRYGKNLIGAFHQPKLVLADVDTLATLPRRQLLAGYAEVVKYGLLGDLGFFEWLEQNGRRLVDGDRDALGEAVYRSCEAKARIVERDEKETGDRALLNLGHTFGHALEAEAGYGDRLLHGEAVAVGMAMAFTLSARLGLCSLQEVSRMLAHMRAAGLPVSSADVGLAGIPAERLIEHMRQDKKVVGGRLTFILARRIGESFVSRDVAESDLLAMLQQEQAA